MTATLADQFNQIACVEGTYGSPSVCEQSSASPEYLRSQTSMVLGVRSALKPEA